MTPEMMSNPSVVGRAAGTRSANISAYTAAAAMADSPVAAATYLAAKPKMRKLDSTLLMVLAADKEGRHGLLHQLGFEGLQPDMVSVLAGGELERRKWVKDKWVAVALAAIAGLFALTVALLRSRP